MPYFVGPKDALMRFHDPEGIERSCVVVLVCREFGTTRVREYYYGWIGEKYAGDSVQIPPVATRYQHEDVRSRSYPPTPKSGGRFEDMGDYYLLTVYFDDIILDRRSGDFSIREPDESPFTYMRTDALMCVAVERRRHVPEFYIQ